MGFGSISKFKIRINVKPKKMNKLQGLKIYLGQSLHSKCKSINTQIWSKYRHHFYTLSLSHGQTSKKPWPLEQLVTSNTGASNKGQMSFRYWHNPEKKKRKVKETETSSKSSYMNKRARFQPRCQGSTQTGMYLNLFLKTNETLSRLTFLVVKVTPAHQKHLIFFYECS